MTPDAQAAAERIQAFLDARGPDRDNVISTAGPRSARYTKPRLRVDDLQLLLAALDPAEDAEQVSLDAVYAADGVQFDFEALRRYFRRAVTYALPHATGSSEGWRAASVEQLAEWMTNFFTAGIGPTLSEEAVAGGVKVARQFLADERATRHRPLTDQPCGVTTTPRGRQAVLDYHAIRQRQNPRGADQ